MLDVSSNISTFIEEQYPALYREEGNFLVEFTKAYYDFNDSTMDRNIPKLRDLDTTLANFLIFFKKKFLHELPLDTIIDTKFIIKHIQDLYKRKGSEESLRLLFQMFYDTEIEVFYPSQNILKPSDSVWGGAIYLELQAVATVIGYPIQRGDKLNGDISGAVGFVDEIVFINFTGSLIPIAYLSNVSGTFTSDDGILVTRGTASPVNRGKLIQGSVSTVTVDSGSRIAGQQIGDKLKLQSAESGTSATASVKSVSTVSTGQIDFAISDTGYGFVLPVFDADGNPVLTGPQNDILISNQVVVLQQSLTPTINVGDWIYAEGHSSAVTQISTASGAASVSGNITGGGRIVGYDHPLVYVNTIDRTRAQFLTYVHAQITLAFNKDSSIDPKMSAVFNRNHSTGYRIGDITNSGYVANEDRHITQADVDAMTAYIGGSADAAKTAWIENILLPNIFSIGYGHDFNILPTNGQADFIVGTQTLNAVNIGAFNATASYTIDSISATDRENVDIIVDLIGDFANTPLQVTVNATAMVNPKVYEINVPGNTNFTSVGAANNNVGTRFTATGAGGGTGTVVDVVETNYRMSGSTEETLNTKFKDAFIPLNVTIGSIDNISVTSAGSQYTSNVFTEANFADVSRFDKRDPILTFNAPDFLLEVGDIVTQNITIENPDLSSATATIAYVAKGRFLKREGNDFYFKQLKFYDFQVGVGVNIRGNLETLSAITRDSTSLPMGRNAVIDGPASFQTGQIESVDILNTGYRYADNERVSLLDTNDLVVATAKIRTQGPGLTEGRWRTTTSFLSENTKKLADNYYYQEYSYDIGSIVDPDKYKSLIDNVVGVAGTKLFSSPLINSNNDLSSKLDVEFQVWDITTNALQNEEGTQNINTEQNTALVATIITLDTSTSASITTSIGT